MNLSQTITALQNTISRYQAEYTAGRIRQDAFAPYATPRAVLAALEPKSRVGERARGELVLAIVAEQQRKEHPLWQAMLVAGFGPMLKKTRKLLSTERDEDLDQEVLVAFLAAVKALPRVATVPCPRHALRVETTRRAFVAMNAALRGPETEPFNEETHACDPFCASVVDALVDASAEVAALLTRKHGADAELSDVILATYAGEESLKEYVDRTYAASSEAERVAAYERLKSARRRIRERAAA